MAYDNIAKTMLLQSLPVWLSRHLIAQKVLNFYEKQQSCCFAGASSKAQSPLSPHMQQPLKINTMDSITDRSSDQLRSVSPESCVDESAQSGLPGRTAEYLSMKLEITAKHAANAVWSLPCPWWKMQSCWQKRWTVQKPVVCRGVCRSHGEKCSHVDEKGERCKTPVVRHGVCITHGAKVVWSRSLLPWVFQNMMLSWHRIGRKRGRQNWGHPPTQF